MDYRVWIRSRRVAANSRVLQRHNAVCSADYVERYSWFGAFRSNASNVGPNGCMLTQDGKLTDIGSWYLGGAATNNVPSVASKIYGVGKDIWVVVILVMVMNLLWLMV